MSKPMYSVIDLASHFGITPQRMKIMLRRKNAPQPIMYHSDIVRDRSGNSPSVNRFYKANNPRYYDLAVVKEWYHGCH